MTNTTKRKNRKPKDRVPELKPGMHYYPRSPSASIEQLLAIAGIVSLDGPAPSHKFIDDESAELTDEHDGN